MKTRIGLTLAAISLLLGGCVSPPQVPIELAPNSLTGTTGRVGIVMTALPKVDTEFPGAGCLLCYATASAANSSLTSHAQTLPYEDLPKLKNEMADVLRKKGTNVVVIAEDLNVEALSDADNKGPNIAAKNFGPLKQKYYVDKLLVINITSLGFVRTYSAYIPTSDPKAVVQGKGYLVNLSNNTYEWYLPVNVTKSADKNWDEPPKYPGLTNAYFQVLELGKDNFLLPFGK